MPQKRMIIDDFSKGLVSEADPRKLPLGACSDGENVRLHRGSIRVREGRAYHADNPGSGAPSALVEYRREGASLEALQAGFDDGKGPGLLLAQGETLYAALDAAQTDFAEVEGLALATGQRPRMAQYKDKVYIVDGEHGVRAWRWDGVTALVDLTPPLTAPTITPVTAEARELANCDEGEVTGNNTGYFRTGDDYHRRITAANAIRWHAEPLYGKASTDKTEFKGCYVRQFNAQEDADALVAPMVGMEIIGEIDAGTYDFSARMITPLTPEVSGNVLPQANMIEVQFKVLCGGDVLPAISLQLGTERTSINDADPSMTIAIALDLTGEQPDSWITRTIQLDGVYTPAQLRTMKWLAFEVNPIGAVTALATRTETTAATVLPDETGALTFLVHHVAVDVADSTLVPGAAYEFCYVYSWLDGTQYLYSNRSPISAKFPVASSVYNTTMALEITFDVRELADYSNGVYPNVHVFVRGVSAEFALIARKSATEMALNEETNDGGAYAITWEGDYLTAGEGEDNPFLPKYTPAPVTGCNHIIEHRGRMVYGRGDTLYISHWDEPDKVPDEGYIAIDPTDGTWARVGLDGSPMVGLGRLGSYLVIFKMRSVWMLEGDDLTTFTLVQVSDGHGCSSHESIAQLDGAMLAWRDGEHVWAWDGQHFRDIGLPIRDLLKAHAAAQVLGSVACYDPAERVYLLTVPGSGELTGTTHAFELTTGAWNPKWTNQPGAALCYAQTLATPGMYAADAAGVYRLFSGEVDAIDAETDDAIAFSWVSGAIEAPYAGRNKDVRAIHAVTAYKDTLTRVGFGLRVNGSTVNRAAKLGVQVKQAAGSPGLATWLPSPLSDVDAFAVQVSGESRSGGEVVRIEALVGAKGASR